jgi:tetrapyrrole methylase family protein / MazG family protein
MGFDLDSPDTGILDSMEKPEELFLVLAGIMERLRSDRGCLWDRKQDHSSLKKSLIEEAYETVEAIDSGDAGELKEELGDLLLQIVFHGQIAQEEGSFTHADIIRGIIKKLLRRHPHVFSHASASSSREILENWEEIKKQERKGSKKEKDSIFSGIPRSLPGLHYAYEIQNRASRLGFDWEKAEDVYEKVKEEIAELETEAVKGSREAVSGELGDLLFSIVNYGRHMDIDIEKSLKGTCKRFISRFKMMEDMAAERGEDFKSLTLEEKDRLWEKAKKRQKL